MKFQTYLKLYNPESNIPEDSKFKYPQEFNTFWEKRNKLLHKGKIISAIVDRFGMQIIRSDSSLNYFFKTNIDKLPKMLDFFEDNLTDDVKSVLKPIHEIEDEKILAIEGVEISSPSSTPIGQSVVLMDPSPPESRPISKNVLTSLEKEKWLNDTEIHLYLR
jgi:hypothetical protein